MTTKIPQIALGAALIGLTSPLHAVLLASDEFTNTTNSGTGWSGNWAAPKPLVSNLTYPSLTSTGGAAGSGGYAFRTLAAAQTTGIIYVSGLIQSSLGNFAGFEGLSNFALFDAGVEKVSFGAVFDGSGTAPNYGLWLAQTAAYQDTGTAMTAAARLFVLELDLDANTGKAWLDPSTSTPLGTPTLTFAATGTQTFDFNRIRIETNGVGGAGSVVDEFRIGTTQADIGIIPEPSSAAILLLTAIAGLLPRRRK